MTKWLESILKSERAKLSEELIDQSARVRELPRAAPNRSIFEVFAQVAREFSQEEETPA